MDKTFLEFNLPVARYQREKSAEERRTEREEFHNTMVVGLAKNA
jgi:hypothetical protein